MRIRHPVLIKAGGLTSAWAVRLWIGTLRFRYRPLGPENLDPHQASLNGRYLYAIWHENILLPVYQFCRANVGVLVSRHTDGALLAEACRHLRVPMVRGSTKRGAVQAVRKLIRVGKTTHLAITPDGPRGPRRRVQPGIIYLAARTGLQIVPTGIGYARPWRLESWDHFALPRPWTLGTCVTGSPIAVPATVDPGQLEPYRLAVEASLHQVSSVAEHWAEDGRFTARPKAG
jgi:lysophospholipid acyltransferase (LPLAT)-like uncharacterized protein